MQRFFFESFSMASMLILSFPCFRIFLKQVQFSRFGVLTPMFTHTQTIPTTHHTHLTKRQHSLRSQTHTKKKNETEKLWKLNKKMKKTNKNKQKGIVCTVFITEISLYRYCKLANIEPTHTGVLTLTAAEYRNVILIIIYLGGIVSFFSVLYLLFSRLEIHSTHINIPPLFCPCYGLSISDTII